MLGTVEYLLIKPKFEVVHSGVERDLCPISLTMMRNSEYIDDFTYVAAATGTDSKLKKI